MGHFEISAIQLFTICAIANGLVFSILLLDKKENRRANRFLSLMTFCLCLTFTPYMVAPSLWHQYNWLVWMPFSFSYWIGPSLYFYVRALTRPEVPFRRGDYWHFSFIFLNYLHSIYHFSVGKANPYPWFHMGAEMLESAAIISIFIYLTVCYRMINRHQKSLLHYSSGSEGINLRWMQQVIEVLGISFLFILVFLLVSSAFLGKQTLHEWDNHLSVMILMYSVILYWFSIHGYRQAQMISVPAYLPPVQTQDETSHILEMLKNTMADHQLYRRPNLSLSDLSKSVGVSERVLSRALNQGLQKNFFQFVNDYRVEEMKAKLLDPAFDHWKIFSIALEAGFNSKASYNRVFKSFTGYTPKQFRSINRDKSTS